MATKQKYRTNLRLHSPSSTANKNSSGDDIPNVNSTFTQCARKLPEFAEITQNNSIMPFKVTQRHRFWYQSKAHIRFPISD